MRNSDTFKGWRKLGPRDVLHGSDRWTFRPELFKSPKEMLKVDSWYEHLDGAQCPRKLFVTVRDALKLAPYVFFRQSEK